jgi:hypothetical protein
VDPGPGADAPGPPPARLTADPTPDAGTAGSWKAVRALAGLALVAGIAIKVWVWALGRSLGLDEEMISMNIRSRGLGGLTGQLNDDQAAPLGWLWVERLALDLNGSGERALKLVPLLFGIGFGVLAYTFGRRWLHPVGALALVVLVGFSYELFTYSDQVKHYSADAFWVMALLAGAWWVLDDPRPVRRAVAWWAIAVAGSWLSEGATLAVPALALILVGAVSVRCGPRAAVLAALPGLAWLASFGAVYALSLRYVTGSRYLTDYWQGLGYPPSGSGFGGTLHWYGHQVTVLLGDPLHLGLDIGSGPVKAALGAVFLVLAGFGLVVAFRRRVEYGLLLVAPIVTALLLALFHLVPLVGRLAFWAVPPALIAVSYTVDSAAEVLVRNGFTARRIAAAGLLLGAATLLVPATNSVRATFAPPLLDDRDAIAALRADHRPGDLTLFVAGATRAAQWYDPDHRLGPTLGVISAPAGPACTTRGLVQLARGYRRLVAYAGVRFSPYLRTYQVLRVQLAALGTVRVRPFGTDGMVYVVDLASPGPTTVAPTGHPAECIETA